MIASDAIIIALYAIILGCIKTRDSLVVLVAFFLSALYASSPLYDSHPAYVNHLIYSLYFIPTLYYLQKQPFIYVALYIVYHWVVSGDYIFFAQETVISQTFGFVSPVLNGLIMLSLIYARHDYVYHPVRGVVSGWLPNLLHNLRHSKKMEKN